MTAATRPDLLLDMRRGRRLARTGAVAHRTPQRDIADVTDGSRTFRVTLHLGESTCTCGQPQRCVHAWALFESPDFRTAS